MKEKEGIRDDKEDGGLGEVKKRQENSPAECKKNESIRTKGFNRIKFSSALGGEQAKDQANHRSYSEGK